MITKTPELAAAIYANNTLNQLQSVATQTKNSLANGFPANPSQGMPAVTPEEFAAALGTNIMVVSTVISAVLT